MSKATDKTDAGLKEQDHYKLRLPWYRYAPRQVLLPLVRYETEYLAALQQSIRTNALDSYFSITANLGTHTFFMLFLPVLAWCGQPNLCRAMVQILAAGVFYTGGLKDFLCLPRPLSPPLVRITMSHGAALEYGFPSTHSCNALSVAVYALLALNDPKTSIEPNLKIALEALAATYAVSIVLGRLYCGMHGFLDVFVGSAMGAAISLIQYRLVGQFDEWFLTNGVTSLVVVFALTLFAIRVHPEPADDCPCFDDSVAFAGVVLGIEASNWMHAQRLPRIDSFTRANAFDMERLGLTRTILRVFLGISTIIIWRKVAKKILLKSLPPLFRLVGRAGFLLPRRFFKQAPDYDKVPSGIQMDTLIPPISRLPSFFKSIAHPRKNRSISIGPQSAADAYETIAYRQKVRRESQDKLAPPAIGPRARVGPSAGMTDYFQARPAATSALAQPHMPPTPASSTSNLQNGTIASDTAVHTPPTPADSTQQSASMSRTPSSDRREREEEHAVFASLPKPRTKFDIEIATKLTVYSGIGFIVTGVAPLAFEALGLV